MNEDQLWAEIDRQRDRTAEVLAGLGDAGWDQPSLCTDWTVREVAAHLTLQQLGVRDVLRNVRRWPKVALAGDMNMMIKLAAARQAEELGQQATVDAIRAMIGSRRHNLGVTAYETLTDIGVHSQDIAIPLGRDLPLSVEAAVVIAQGAWRRGWPWYAAKRYRGLEFHATDTDLVLGEGTEVSGPAAAIALLLTGRDVARDRLHGLPAPG